MILLSCEHSYVPFFHWKDKQKVSLKGLVRLLVLFLFSLSSLASFAVERAVQSDQFVDSAGINVHLHYTDTLYYSQYSAIKSRLVQLGIRHVRDGLIDTSLQAYYDRHNELGSLGIGSIYIAVKGANKDVLKNYPSKMSQSFEGYENLNEYDATGDSVWSSTLKTNVASVYSAARSGVSPSSIVIAPSLVQVDSFSQLGNMSSYVDRGNMHNYFGGHNPGNPGWWGAGYSNYGSIAFALGMEAIVAPSKAVITTETGYTNDPSVGAYVPEDVSATYFPRLFLEQWRAGVQRTYLYELLSVGGEDYGLLRKDGAAKPGFWAVANLLKLLADPGSSFPTSKLDFTLTGGDSNTHHLLMQKRDGTFYLAIWNEASGYDVDHKVYTPVASQRVTLYIPHSVGSMNKYQWDSSGNVATQALGSSQSQTLTVTDKLQILEIKLAGSGQLTTTLTPSIGGSLTVSPQTSDGIYTSGQSVTLTALPAAGYRFAGYTGSATISANPATISVTGKMDMVANFACTYKLAPSLTSLPASAGSMVVAVTTGSGCAWSASSDASWATVPSATYQGSGSFTVGYTANGSTSRQATLSVGGTALVLTQSGGKTVKMNFLSSPSGAAILLDGVTVTTPYTLNAYVGSTHKVDIAATQTYGGATYLLYGWSGVTDSASANSAHTVTAGTADSSYTVTMVAGNKLTTKVSGSGSLTVSPDPSATNGYYKPTTKVNIYAVPAAGCSFSGYSGNYTSLQGTIASVIMAQPATVTATFKCN